LNIITFSGKFGAGKNYSATMLEGMLSRDTHELAYGNGVKSIATSMGWDGIKDTKGRKLLQTIGEAGRQYDKDIWIKLVISQIELIASYNKEAVICITDARFPNEIKLIQDAFGEANVLTLLIKGRQYDMKELNNDVSETSLDNYTFDCIIDNSSTDVCLREQLSAVALTKGLI